MDVLTDYLWEALYVLKELYNHGKGETLFESYRGKAIDSDDFYELAMEAIGHVFADTRTYYNEEKEIETNVFYDPVITDFYRLCEQFETEHGLSSKDNPYRQSMDRAISSAMSFNSYSYNYEIHETTKKERGCHLVLMFDCEFCVHYEAVGGLLNVYDAYEYETKRLKRALGLEKPCQVLTMPSAATEEQEAA